MNIIEIVAKIKKEKKKTHRKQNTTLSSLHSTHEMDQ
jgi:hypothetical protein